MTDNTNKMENNEVDLKAELEKDLEGESSDVMKYMKLADVAEAKYPHCWYAAILRDIAKEEMTHNRHLKAILSDIHNKEAEM